MRLFAIAKPVRARDAAPRECPTVRKDRSTRVLNFEQIMDSKTQPAPVLLIAHS